VVTNEQLYIAVGIPMLFNATLIGLVVALFNAKFSRFEARFDAIDKRFDDMRDLWRAELRRVEEVLDARLKHIEERG
jgi:Mor family transcriptional regulator